MANLGKQPYMPFYVNDWLSSPRVMVMNAAERGAYIQLICYCWASGDASLPDDEQALAKLSGLNEGWLNGGCKMVRVCFESHPNQNGKLTHRRVYEEWQKRLAWSEKSRKGGRKSGNARRLRKTKGGSRVVEPPYEPNVNHSLDNDNEDLLISSSRKRTTKQARDSAAVASKVEAVQRVINHYLSFHPRAKPGDQEQRLVSRRLEKYTADELCEAIDGCHRSPHHCGQNERSTKYQTLELIVRDNKHVDMFREFADGTASQDDFMAEYRDSKK